MKILARTVSLANLPALTVEELTVRSRDWAEALFPSVREERLRDAFTRAIADHKTTFAISFYEIKTAWDAIAMDEKMAEYKRREVELDDLDRKRRLAEIRVCQVCHGSGFKDAGTREFAGRDYPQVTRSYGCCDYWERRRQNNERGRMDKIDKG
jgi:hypothetical protein